MILKERKMDSNRRVVQRHVEATPIRSFRRL